MLLKSSLLIVVFSSFQSQHFLGPTKPDWIPVEYLRTNSQKNMLTINEQDFIALESVNPKIKKIEALNAIVEQAKKLITKNQSLIEAEKTKIETTHFYIKKTICDHLIGSCSNNTSQPSVFISVWLISFLSLEDPVEANSLLFAIIKELISLAFRDPKINEHDAELAALRRALSISRDLKKSALEFYKINKFFSPYLWNRNKYPHTFAKDNPFIQRELAPELSELVNHVPIFAGEPTKFEQESLASFKKLESIIINDSGTLFDLDMKTGFISFKDAQP